MIALFFSGKSWLHLEWAAVPSSGRSTIRRRFFFGRSVGCHLCRQFTQLREERSVTDCRILKRKFHFMFQHLLLKIALCCTSFNLRPAAKCTFCAICDTISVQSSRKLKSEMEPVVLLHNSSHRTHFIQRPKLCKIKLCHLKWCAIDSARRTIIC